MFTKKMMLAIWAFAVLVCQPLAARAAVSSPLANPLTESFKMTSRSNGETYQIDVSLPAVYNAGGPSQGFPIVYVLDGQWLFSTAQWVAVGGIFDVSIPPVIVVGIRCTSAHDEMMAARLRNFMPFSVKGMPGGGHAVDFRRFLSDELIPAVEAKYKVHGPRALVGFSLSGLFTLDTLISDPDLFDIYIADSPSLAFDDGSFQRRFNLLPSNFLHKQTRVYLSWGGDEVLVDQARAFGRELQRRQFSDLQFWAGPVGHVGHSVSSVEAIAEGMIYGLASEAVQLPQGRVNQYAGRYTSADGKTSTLIETRLGRTTIDFSELGVLFKYVPLIVIGEDHLIAKSNFIEIWFRRNASDQVDGARMVIEGQESELSRSAAAPAR